MNPFRSFILAFALLAGISPAYPQVPAPVPALPDTERRTSYSITASTCSCSVGFQLYGDSTDYANWIEVFVNGALIPQAGNWSLSTATTGGFATGARPITDAVLTFAAAQTGTVQIVGARRPRRTSQFSESQPVPTRNFNVVLSDLTAQLRENWDKTNDITGRGIFAAPGETLNLLASAAARKNQLLGFDASGQVAYYSPGPGFLTSLLPGLPVENCGAVGNGIADDAPAIRACASQVAAQALGGSIQLGCNKTYLLASKDSLGNGIAILHPYSNVTYYGCGDSSVLKVANNMNTVSTNFAVIYPADETSTYTVNNFTVRNFKIDFNGNNNNCSNTCNYQNVGVAVRFGDNILVDNVTFLNNPGSQDTSFGLNSGLTVNRVSVRNSRSYDACDKVNTACTDHSAFYAVATQFNVIGSLCTQTAQSNAVTCIEGHGLELNFVGNSDLNVNKSFNIAAQIGHAANTAVIDGHTSFGAQKGIQLFALDSKTVNNVNISNSVWRRSATNFNQSVAFMDFDQSVTSTGTTNVTLNNVTIDGAAIAAGTTDVTPVILIGRSANTVISNSTITGNSGECIATGTMTSASSATIMNNTLIDCGQTSVAGHRRGILAPASGTAASFNVMNNRIANVATTYMTTGIDIAMNVSSGYIAPNNRVENVAQGVSITGTGYFPTSTFGLLWSSGQGIPPQSTAALTNGQLIVGQTGAAPLPKTITGLVAFDNNGVTTCPTCVQISGTAHGDSAYAILSTDRYVFTNAAFTLPRIWTLPAANSLPVGTTIWVQDAQGTVTTTNTLTISRAGADTIDVANTTLVITGAGGGITFTTDGVSNWGTPIQTVTTGGTGQKTLTSNGPLFGSGTNPISAGTAGTNGQLMLGVTGSPGAFATMSQDCSITNAGVMTCPKTNNVAFGALATVAAGTGVATAAAVNVGTAGSVVVNGGAGGTPSSLTLTSATGLPASGMIASTAVNSLGANVAMNNVANYFPGPTVAQGTAGTWFCSGTITVSDSAGASVFHAKLWDGTTVISSIAEQSGAASAAIGVSLSGVITSPAANIRIDVKDTSSVNGAMLFNTTGNSKDSTLTCHRIG